MAIKEVLMPNLGESVTEASVTNWLVKHGDKVKRYDPLMEVVSDKVTTEVPSDFDGEVKEFLIDLDQSVPIGTAILTLEVEGAADETPTVEEKQSESSQEKPKATQPTPLQEKNLKISDACRRLLFD